MARRTTARPLPAWVGDLPVFERTLPNGFRVLVLPRKHARLVVCDLYYPAGSYDEPAGRTGLAHFVEHMLFKGTERFPKGHVDRLTFAAAGQSNAETSEDATHYWFAFPTENWELALEIEADRMRGALFDPREVEAERHVIGEEWARDLDSPFSRLDQNHLAVSYLRHPYRNPILGWPEDLAAITVEDLRGFYDRHYRPDGAVLIVVGDVEPARALDRVAAYFGSIERAGDRPEPVWIEPRQTGRREFTLLDSEAVARGLLGWHTVPRGHRDGPALNVLSDLLSCGRRARLWDALVERQRMATWVDVAQEGARRAGQLVLQVEAAHDVPPVQIEEAINTVLGQLADEGPTQAELARSRHRLEAAWRWEQEDLAGLAAGLGQVAPWDDWREWQAEHRAALVVEADDIRRVISTYLADASLTVGWSLPRPHRAVTVLMPADAVPRPRRPAAARAGPERPAPLVLPGPSTRRVDFHPRREVLANGMRLVSERRAGSGIVALEFFVDAGQLREAKPGLGFLTGRMLEEGTLTRSADVLAETIEDVGGTLDVGATGASLRVRAEDLPLALEILADVVRRPAFPAEAFPWVRRRITAELQGDRDDPAFRADLLFRQIVYGDHPYARDPRGSLRELNRLSVDDVRAHHAQHFAADNAVLVAVGDFDPRSLRSQVRTHFQSWEPRGLVPSPVPRPACTARARVRRVAHRGEQLQIVLGHLGIVRNHPDFAPLLVLDHIFGTGPGFTDRLSRIVRDEMGLAYSVGGGITDSADLAPGLFRVYVGTTPEEADRVVAAIVDQVRTMHAGAFSDDEFERARCYVAGSWVFDFQTVEQRAERLLELERFGLGLDEPVHWPAQVAAITPRQVRRAARLHINPAALCRVEFGPIRRRAENPQAECA